jgi:hypothetical protein
LNPAGSGAAKLKCNLGDEKRMNEPKKLYILWTSADVLTAEKMVMMYATNGMLKHWWDDVTVIIWGAAAKLAAEDETIGEKIEAAQKAGVRFSACKACADQLGVAEVLEKMAVEVIYWGEGLTALLQGNQKLLTV